MVVHDSKGALGDVGGLLGSEDTGGGSVGEDGVEDGVVDVVLESGVDGGDLHTHHQGILAWVRLDVVHGDAVAVHCSSAPHKADQGPVRRAGEIEVLYQLTVERGTKKAGGRDDYELVDGVERDASLGDGALADICDERNCHFLVLLKTHLHGQRVAIV